MLLRAPSQSTTTTLLTLPPGVLPACPTPLQPHQVRDGMESALENLRCHSRSCKPQWLQFICSSLPHSMLSAQRLTVELSQAFICQTWWMQNSCKAMSHTLARTWAMTTTSALALCTRERSLVDAASMAP